MVTKRFIETIAFIIFYLLVYLCGRIFAGKLKKCSGNPWIFNHMFGNTIVCLLSAILGQYFVLPGIHLFFGGVAVFLFALKGIEPFESREYFHKGIFGVGAVCSLMALFQVILHYDSFRNILGDGSKALILKNTWLMILTWCTVIQMAQLFAGWMWGGKIQRKEIMPVPVYVVGTYASVVVFGWLINIYGLNTGANLVSVVFNFMSEPVHILNIMIWLTLSIAILFFWGIRLGSVINILLLAVIFIANFIKLKFHSTFFSWFDLLQMKEMFLMGKEFLSTLQWMMVGVTLFILAVLIIKFRRKLGRFLKPVCAPVKGIVNLLFFVFLIHAVLDSAFNDIDIYPRTWENKSINVRDNGLVVNLIFDFDTLSEAVMEKPENYNQETANALQLEFAALNNAGENTKSDMHPDVILILAESLFDLSSAPGIEIDTKINSTIKEYSNMDMISPRYGGYTSAMEFEALTGMSLAFLPDALTPYTTYFSNSGNAFPSVVQNFKENGYYTQVIHPDLPQFYNRDIVYSAFGFDNYQSIVDFQDVPDDMTTENGWVKDAFLEGRIIEELEKTENPQFLFAITMEEHYVTLDKYSTTGVHVSGEGMTEQDQHEIEQQAQSYYNTDQMIANLIDYMNQTDRPTLLYIFGDHLPPIEYLSVSGFLADKDNKYTTTFVRYANYKELSAVADAITPNQIAALMVNDAGIEHSSYFDYIYSLLDTCPVLHKEYVDVNSEKFDIYRFIQYDIMFGEKYLAQ